MTTGLRKKHYGDFPSWRAMAEDMLSRGWIWTGTGWLEPGTTRAQAARRAPADKDYITKVEELPQLPPAERARGVTIPPLEAKPRVVPEPPTAEPTATEIPETGGWQVTPEGMYISPEGRWFTERELEWEIRGPEFPLIEEPTPFEAVFPEEDIETLFRGMAIEPDMPVPERIRAEQAQKEFIGSIQEIGRTPDTEALLRQLGATEEQVTEFFPTITEEFKREETKFWAERHAGMSLPEKALNSFIAGVGDVLSTSGGVARRFGYDDAGATLSSMGSDLQRFVPPRGTEEFEVTDLLNPEWWAEFARYVPFALSLAPLAIGGFYGGSTIAGAAGLGWIGSTIVGGLTGAALSRPAESALEAGASYDDAIARGKTVKEAQEEFDEVFRNNMVLAGADAWEIAIALAPTPKWVPASLIKSGLVRTARVAGKMVIVGLSEGGEEVYQDMIQRHARGEEWKLDPISKEVFAIGAIMGMGMGLGGDIVQTVVNRTKTKLPPDLNGEFLNHVNNFLKDGLTTEQAELKALNEIAKTPEGRKLIADAIEETKAEIPVKPAIPEAIPEVEPEITEAEEVGLRIDEMRAEVSGLKEWLSTEPAVKLTGLIKRIGWKKGEVAHLTLKQYRDITGKEEIVPSILTPDKKHVRWEYALDDVATEMGYESGEALKTEIERAGESPARIKELERELAVTRVPEVVPPAVEEVPEIEEAPERAVFAEGGVPVSPDEPISQQVADNIPIIQDIGIKERWVRPTRFVFQRMGLYETYKGIQRAEVEIGEAQKVAIEDIRKLSKRVEKDRWSLIADEVDESGSVSGLTFEERRVVSSIRKWADEWANKKNLPQEKRIKDYLPHLFEQEMVDQLKETGRIPAELANMLSEKVPKKITDPFLKKRLGAVGWIRDPFAAMVAYEKAALRVLYYEPMLQKIAATANDIDTPPIARDYLKDYARRMTSQPSKLDTAINNTLQEFAGAIEKLPGGEPLARFLTQGNPSGMAAYNFTSLIYTLWLGFKPTSAIRNLSQHTLIIGEVGPVHFADGIKLRFTKEGRAALEESLVWRSRRAAFVPGIDDSFAERWSDDFREAALWMFRKADEQNVKDAFLAGYSEAKSLLPEADRQVWIDRGDEVAADTQYLYTKMNSMAVSQSSMGRVFSILTTWSENWMELMTKWVSRRPSQVYLQYEKQTGIKVTGANWSTSYKAILMYMAIIGLGYAIKERERLKAWEYTGITSVRYLADVAGGDFPGLQAPGAVANIIAGFLTDDERRLKTGWAEFKGTFTPGIVRQLEDVAMGEKDWLTLFFYLEGKDFYIRQLKNKWEKGWKDYEALETTKERDEYRKNNPIIEAQMFITGKFTTLTTEEARQEVLRIIEKNKLDTELIDGYDKIFGVDTDKQFTDSKKLLGTVELTEEGEQKVKENGELDYYTTSNFGSDVNKLEKVVGRYKIEKDGNPLAVEYLRAKDSFVQYESLTEDDARALFRQQFPDVEAQLYLWGRIASFKNPKSAEILLGLMEKYGIPPEAVPAFLEKPERYDELFTQKFELKQKGFDLTTEYENYGNLESPLYIEDDEARKEAREKLKEDNPNWVADMRRIEAIDHDASPEIIESWAGRGKTIDEFGAGSSEAKVWLLDNPEVHKWALEQKLLTDDGADWNEAVLRINVEMAGLIEDSAKYLTLKRRKEAYTEGIPEAQIDNYVAYYDLPVAGYRQERFLINHPDLSEAIGLEVPERVPSEQYDILLEKEDKTPEDERRMEAYKAYFPDDMVETYVDYYSLERKGYEDDWFLMEHGSFYNTARKILNWQPRDFTKTPSRGVYHLYQVYTGLTLGQARLDFRVQNPELDDWLVLAKGLTPIGERGEEEADLSQAEKFARELLEIEERLKKLK